MAMIVCPECGEPVSDKAKSCPHCGCPIAEMQENKKVKIKIPMNSGAMLFTVPKCKIYGRNPREELWHGTMGEVATFDLNEPADIEIDLGSWANAVNGHIEPGHKYTLVQQGGFHWLATFTLSEVDIIDAD